MIENVILVVILTLMFVILLGTGGLVLDLVMDTEIKLGDNFTIINPETQSEYTCQVDEIENKLLLLCLGEK
jgi:hypothetical protein